MQDDYFDPIIKEIRDEQAREARLNSFCDFLIGGMLFAFVLLAVYAKC